MRQKIGLVVLVMLLLLGGTAVQAAPPEITDIQVEGNQKVSDAKIINEMELEVGDKIDRDKLKQDLQSIIDVGYFSNVGVDFKPYKSGVQLIVKVEENPSLAEVEFEGNQVVSDSKLKELLGLAAGQIIDSNQIKKGIKKIEGYYGKEGYALARVIKREVKEDGKLYLRIAEGELNKIVVEGTEKTKDYVVTREISINPGEIIKFSQLRKDLRKLHDMDYFKQVEPKFKRAKEDPTKINLIIQVEEKPSRSLAGGLTHSAGSGLAGLVEFKNKNLFGEGKKIGLDLEYGPERHRYEFNFSQDWTFDRPLSMDLGVYRKLDTTPDDEEVLKRGGNINLGYPLVNDFRGYFGLDIEQTQEDTGWEPSHSLTLRTIRNTSNQRFNPSQGSRVSLGVEKSGIFGGSKNYTKYETDFRKYFSAGEAGSIAARLKLGTADGDDLPSHERFFVTSRGGVRGYSSDHYLAEDYDDRASFVGDSIAVANLEYRHQLMDKLTLLTFLDAGRSFKSDIEFDELGNLHYSAGLGFRIKTPVGQLGADYGYAPEGDSGEKTEFQITVGHSF